MNLTKLLLFIAGLLPFSITSLKSQITFSETGDLREAISTYPMVAANTKEDAELMAALFERHADFDEFNKFATQRNLFVLRAGAHLMIDRIEVTPGSYYYAAIVLIHQRGSSQAFWIDVFSLLHGCIKSD
jgi:hypothetical protein